MKIKAFGKSDTGRIRANNEDNFIIGDLNTGKKTNSFDVSDVGKGILLLVADGMGGAAAGEVAAEAVVEHCFNYIHYHINLDPERALREAIFEAHTAIQNIVRESPDKQGMGSVATLLYVTEKKSYAAQVGDTRLYRLRNEDLKQLTEDQSLVADLTRAGKITAEQARVHPLRNQVNQAIGPTENLTPIVEMVDIKPGDRLMLCSDGLNGMLDDLVMKNQLIKYSDQNELAEKLVELANNQGGHDNITLVLADLIDN